uniref:Uncharacterized protein n=1 Tax=Cryptomonas curvata TaxID=233186 RepID=A0A7S0MAH1_9CRYP|mmetsp:Transcript_32140/g.67177  ORF Transcript_32140/g.67177 Transcript_32140/m.67177 type:complete len:331 (+) Transcript_32140:102-1094(+)
MEESIQPTKMAKPAKRHIMDESIESDLSGKRAKPDETPESEAVNSKTVQNVIRFNLQWPSQMRASNDFEKSVFALLDGTRNLDCVKSYQLTSYGHEKYQERFNKPFFASWCEVFPSSEQPSDGTPARSTLYELDCLVKLNESVTLWEICKEVVSGSKEYIIPLLNGVCQPEGMTFEEGDHLHIEITDGSSKISRKLFQFERTMEFWDSIVEGSRPRACVLILNGSIENVKEFCDEVAVNNWPADTRRPYIFDTPCYICFKPYTNVYKVMKDMKDDMANLETRMKSSLIDGFLLSMMTQEQLASECKKLFPIDQTIDGKTKAELLSLLMSQ